MSSAASQGPRLLLLGGTGFLSSYLLRAAHERGYQVTYVTRGQRPPSPLAGVRHVVADRNVDDLPRKLAGAFDVVLDAICFDAGHARQARRLAGAGRLVMISTDYVYEPTARRLRQREDDARFSEREDYGGRKRQAEQEVLSAERATVLRPPHIYGPGSRPGTIPRHGRKAGLLADIAAGKPLDLLAGGLGLIQPIFVADLARIAVALLEVPEAAGQAVNCAGPELMTHADYYRALGAAIGCEVQIRPWYPDDPGEINAYVGGHRYYDTGKLEALLPGFGYTPAAQGFAQWARQLKQGA